MRCTVTATSVHAADGTTALATLLRNRHDAVVLDVLMPEPGGLEVCRAIRARGDDTPILMLTARDLISDRVAGLDAGADDYLAKPFALEELRARLRALQRRSGAGAGLLRFAGIDLDVAAHQATRRGMRLPLTKTEFALLELFLRNPAGCFPGPRYSNRCGGTTSAQNRTLCGSISATCGGRWASRG